MFGTSSNLSDKQATVMKYADWLENPVDPAPVCPLCQRELSTEDEKIRFMNLRMFPCNQPFSSCRTLQFGGN